jgi:hypothetical protein
MNEQVTTKVWKLLLGLTFVAVCCFGVGALMLPKPSSPTVTDEIKYQMPRSAWGVNGHSQGACSDGTYVWWSCGDVIAKSNADNPDWNNPLAINEHPKEDGTPTDEINGVFVNGDYIYASAPSFLTTPAVFYVKWYDKNTLVFVGEQQLGWAGGADTQEGISYNDGYWWVCYYDAGYVSRYMSDWEFDGSFDLPNNPKGIQGLDWVNSQLWVTTSWKNNITKYNWDGNKFTGAGVVKLPSAVVNEQSFGVTPDEKYLWLAGFSKDSQWELLYRLTLRW